PAGAAQNRQQLATAAKGLDKGPYSQRLRYAILAGDLEGPEKARAALAALEKERADGEVTARPSSVEAVALLDHLYWGYENGWDVPEPGGAGLAGAAGHTVAAGARGRRPHVRGQAGAAHVHGAGDVPGDDADAGPELAAHAADDAADEGGHEPAGLGAEPPHR